MSTAKQEPPLKPFLLVFSKICCIHAKFRPHIKLHLYVHTDKRGQDGLMYSKIAVLLKRMMSHAKQALVKYKSRMN